jgi:hypothetical protein
MKHPTFRAIFVLVIFVSGLLSLSDVNDLTSVTVPAVLEYVEDLDIGETKFKDLPVDMLVNIFFISVAADAILHRSLPHIVLQSSTLDRYQLLSTYRI